jgi:hypothetical protein
MPTDVLRISIASLRSPDGAAFSDLRVGTPSIVAKKVIGRADAASPADIVGLEKWQAR